MESLDTSEKILQTKTSDLTIDTASPVVSKAVLKTAVEASKKLSFTKAIEEETKEPSAKPPISKAKLRREALNSGVYGGSVGMSDNMRIMNGNFRNGSFRDNDSIDVLQNQQNIL